MKKEVNKDMPQDVNLSDIRTVNQTAIRTMGVNKTAIQELDDVLVVNPADVSVYSFVNKEVNQEVLQDVSLSDIRNVDQTESLTMGVLTVAILCLSMIVQL